MKFGQWIDSIVSKNYLVFVLMINFTIGKDSVDSKDQLACKGDMMISPIRNDYFPLDMNLSHRTILMEIIQISDTCICMADIVNLSITLFAERYRVIDKINNLNIPFKKWIHFVRIISPGIHCC